jgi:geranylgeranyl diphosphate synthase type I
MVITAHGQTNDIMNEVVPDVERADIERVLRWKTAEYTFLNPLCVGMVLAGADCSATDAIRDYAIHAGIAFQISDDMLGIFGTEQEHGKSPVDDIREGKRTLLVAHALEHANDTDKVFMLQMLGNNAITPAQFDRCKTIFVNSGALVYARQEAQQHVEQALQALRAESQRWPVADVAFLQQLAEYLLSRTA